MPMPTLPLARLGAFRAELHACCTRRADALFDLADALLCAPAVPSVAHPKPRASPPARLGQRLCRAGPWADQHRAAARPAGQHPAQRRPAGVRGGCDHLAALRRRMLPKPRLLLPPLAPLGRPADRRRLGLAVDRPARLRPRLLDRPRRRGAAAPVGRHRPHHRRADPRAACASPGQRGGAAVRLRRRLRLRPAHPRPGRAAGRAAGTAPIRSPLLRRPTTPIALPERRPATPPWRQVRLHRPQHLAGPDRHPGLSG